MNNCNINSFLIDGTSVEGRKKGEIGRSTREIKIHIKNATIFHITRKPPESQITQFYYPSPSHNPNNPSPAHLNKKTKARH